MNFSDEDKLECITREVVRRKAVYQHWVNEGKMTVADAGHDITCMEAIEQDYQTMIKTRRDQSR